MGQDRAQQGTRSLSKAGMAWSAAPAHARRSPSAARRKLPTCPRPRSTNSTTSGTHCHMSRFAPRGSDRHGPCGLGSGELPASRPGRRPVPREDTLRAHARACLLKGSCSRGASKFSRSTCNAEQRSWSHSAVVFFGLRRHPPMSRGAPVFHQLAYLTRRHSLAEARRCYTPGHNYLYLM